MARVTKLVATMRRMNQPEGNTRLRKTIMTCLYRRSMGCSDLTIAASFYTLQGIVKLGIDNHIPSLLVVAP